MEQNFQNVRMAEFGRVDAESLELNFQNNGMAEFQGGDSRNTEAVLGERRETVKGWDFLIL